MTGLEICFLKSALENETLSLPSELSFDEWQDVVMAMVRPFTVTDPVAFVEKCLFGGIGPAKGFGCGLMLVRRA